MGEQGAVKAGICRVVSTGVGCMSTRYETAFHCQWLGGGTSNLA
jgi:hypothetical protein